MTMTATRGAQAPGGRPRARRLRRVLVPDEAAGLLAALTDTAAEALGRWESVARPLILRALRVAGFYAASAEDALMLLLEQAESVVRQGRGIADELPWMSSVLTNARHQEHRRRLRAERAHRRYAEGIVPWHEPVHHDELREELLHAASRLRPRFAFAVRLKLQGLDAHATRQALSLEFAVGVDHARKIERVALRMMRSALGAPDRGR